MAYPFSDTNNYASTIDLSSLGQFGQPFAAGGTSTPAAGSVNLDVPAVTGGGAANNGAGNWFSNIFNGDAAFGGINKQGGQSTGWAMPAISLLGGVLGMQQQKEAGKLAKGQLTESKRQFDLNYGAQRQTLNTDLEDRQRARVASAGGSGAYESVDSYLDKNRIK